MKNLTILCLVGFALRKNNGKNIESIKTMNLRKQKKKHCL